MSGRIAEDITKARNEEAEQVNNLQENYTGDDINTESTNSSPNA